ncbi:Lysine-specific demethylase JMJ25 [Camellia lanceoleosa]|uniref:Lysine-specific demethylase JMJ25 n=1 Tax=Camellia lanceoleosa TaxID=1840588 RepID=A0ACC0ILS5_9ERIC|nr:Lysine-specific demethylase JMJ25 [Camellia lanceoleosa]
MKDDSRNVKATDFLDWFEFIMGYSKGQIHENGWPQMLKLKDWPSPTAPEDFLLYQRPNFISKLPLLEYIHSKWGLLNVAAKLPHYSLQNDVGSKIFISYGMNEELGIVLMSTTYQGKVKPLKYKRPFTVQASVDGGRPSSASIFVGGFVLGGIVVGALENTQNLARRSWLNSAIDDVSSQLRADDTPNGTAVSLDELEASI